MKKNYQIYRKIWETINRIPVGKVATYGQIAKIAGLGAHARLIGYALHNLPHNSTVPWHRVINSKGEISLSKESGLYYYQKTLLEQENIIFNSNKIDLEKYSWQPELEEC